jgi:hypothetical protein
MNRKSVPPNRRVKQLLLVAVAAIAAASFAPSAMAATVESGSLTWTQANVYEFNAPTNTNRTWAGYTTSPGFTNGTVSASGAATGAAITPQSARGANALYPLTYNTGTGDYDPATRIGTVEFDGVVTFFSPPVSQGGHGFTITVENPQLVLNGNTGTLYASGQGQQSQSGGGSTYDRSQPVFTLDLSGATTAANADGSTTVSGVVPALATAAYVFPANYVVGDGPNRTPNTFGGFSYTVKVEEDTPPPVDSDGDGVADTEDNCVNTVNAGQEDTDGDGTGDACEAPEPPAQSCANTPPASPIARGLWDIGHYVLRPVSAELAAVLENLACSFG